MQDVEEEKNCLQSCIRIHKTQKSLDWPKSAYLAISHSQKRGASAKKRTNDSFEWMKTNGEPIYPATQHFLSKKTVLVLYSTLMTGNKTVFGLKAKFSMGFFYFLLSCTLWMKKQARLKLDSLQGLNLVRVYELVVVIFLWLLDFKRTRLFVEI